MSTLLGQLAAVGSVWCMPLDRATSFLADVRSLGVADAETIAGAKRRQQDRRVARMSGLVTAAGLVGREARLGKLLYRRDDESEGTDAGGASCPVYKLGRLGVIEINGPVYFGLGSMASWMGCVDAEELTRAIQAFEHDDSVEAVLYHLHCPGWGCMGTGDVLAAARALSKAKPVYAGVHEMATSGGMYLASTAREIIATPTAMLGSIGTAAVLTDWSGAYEEMGVKVVEVKTGKKKYVGKLDEDVIEGVRADVEASGGRFIAAVAGARNLSVETVAALDGAHFEATEALANGLCDRIMPFGDFMAELMERHGGGPGGGGAPRPVSAVVSGTGGAGGSNNATHTTEIDMTTANPTKAAETPTTPATPAAPPVQAATPAAPPAPAAATLPELKAIFTDDPAGVIAAMEGGMTVAQAQTKRIADLTAMNTQLTTANKAAEAAAAAAAKNNAKPPSAQNGRAPLVMTPEGGSAQNNGAPVPANGRTGPFWEAVAQIQGELKCSHGDAIKKAVKQHPDLHEQYLQANQRKREN